MVSHKAGKAIGSINSFKSMIPIPNRSELSAHNNHNHHDHHNNYHDPANNHNSGLQPMPAKSLHERWYLLLECHQFLHLLVPNKLLWLQLPILPTNPSSQHQSVRIQSMLEWRNLSGHTIRLRILLLCLLVLRWLLGKQLPEHWSLLVSFGIVLAELQSTSRTTANDASIEFPQQLIRCSPTANDATTVHASKYHAAAIHDERHDDGGLSKTRRA